MSVVFEFSATFEAGGGRKRTHLRHWAILKKKKLFMTLVEDGDFFRGGEAGYDEVL